jgi:hypothetical protein
MLNFLRESWSFPLNQTNIAQTVIHHLPLYILQMLSNPRQAITLRICLIYLRTVLKIFLFQKGVSFLVLESTHYYWNSWPNCTQAIIKYKYISIIFDQPHLSLEKRQRECKSTDSFKIEFAAAVSIECRHRVIDHKFVRVHNVFYLTMFSIFSRYAKLIFQWTTLIT